jgi:NAD(P)-dependent dehydrogenase (short-subunit alcohol dehydrogenase family)
MGKLDGKVIIVTGAGQGTGRGMAIALAKEGAKVVVSDINDNTGKAVAEEIRKLNKQAIFLKCDVGVEKEVKQMVDQAAKEFGPIDVMINNAQTLFTDYDPIENFPESRWDRTYQTGIKGTWYCCKAVFPYMKDRGGKIINFASGWGIMGSPGWCDYAGCKEAIRGFTRTAAKEWAKYKITVNVICPGIDSPSFRKFVEKNPQMAEAKFTLGDPEKDAGRAAIFLSGSESDMFTGHTFHVGIGGIQTVQYP